MPITSNIVLTAGSTVASFVTSGSTSGAAQNLQAAVSNITTQPTAVSGLTARSVNINGRTYYASSDSSSYQQANNIPLIVGLVVGLIGGTLLIAGSVYGYKKYQTKKRGQRLVNDMDVESSSAVSPVQEVQSTVTSSVPFNSRPKITRRTSITSPNNRLHTPLEHHTQERVPSAAMSVTMLDCVTPHNHPAPRKAMPPIELIKFD